MEKQIFQTYVGTKFRKVKDVTYIHGRISGIMHAICDLDNELEMGFGTKITKDGEYIASIYCVKCTKEQYDKFADVIENIYPGLCKFDWKNKKSGLN